MRSLYRSAFSRQSPHSPAQGVEAWIQARLEQHPFCVTRIPFRDLNAWAFEPETGDLAHESGCFFRIEGLRATKSYGQIRAWEQPIINQQEIGILGFLTKEFDGIRHFLVQAKMEPGNFNLIQLSPTVQATYSNYTRVHKGRPPAYLDYFLDPHKRVIVDQLQSEQGTRFLRKRNRNIIIDCPGPVEVLENFCWLTLGQLKALLRRPHCVNMETRSLLACIPYVDEKKTSSLEGIILEIRRAGGNPDAPFTQDLLLSMLATEGHRTDSEIRHWITERKFSDSMRTQYLPLNQLQGGWRRQEECLNHESGRFFSIVAVAVQAGSREVTRWTQPLLDTLAPGITGWICRRIDGILHFLMKLRFEPGNIDIAELAPTISGTDGAYCLYETNHPQFFEFFQNPPPGSIRHDSWQSAEGGRFFQDAARCMILQIEDFPLETAPNFTWMTLGQLQSFIRHNNTINIEARDLLACLDLAAD